MEIDYEKAYKAALETATNWIKAGCTDKVKICLECVFPELRESEDERIRKELLDCLRNLIIKPHGKKLQFMAWLERLNLSDLNLMKEFNKGMQEALMWGREGYKVSPDGKVKSLTQDEMDSILEKQKGSLHISEMCKENADSFTDGIIEVRSFQRGMEEGRRLEKQKEQKDYRKLYDDIAKSDWFKKAYHGKSLGVEDEQKEQKPAEWSEEDEDMFVSVLHFLNTNRINERGKVITWVKSLPERFNLQPKQDAFPSLSEKEIICLKRALDHLRKEHNRYGGKDFSNEIAVLEWLITHPVLAQQLSWKPSEEQVRALQVVVDEHWDVDGDALYSLYTDLKKLM